MLLNIHHFYARLLVPTCPLSKPASVPTSMPYQPAAKEDLECEWVEYVVLQYGTPKLRWRKESSQTLLLEHMNISIGAVPGTGQLYGTNVRVVCSASWKSMPQLWMCLRETNLVICEHGGYRIPSNCTVLKGNILMNIQYMCSKPM